MNSDLNLRAERQPAAVGMVGAVADLSRSTPPGCRCAICTCGFAFHTRNFDMALRGLGTGC